MEIVEQGMSDLECLLKTKDLPAHAKQHVTDSEKLTSSQVTDQSEASEESTANHPPIPIEVENKSEQKNVAKPEARPAAQVKPREILKIYPGPQYADPTLLPEAIPQITKPFNLVAVPNERTETGAPPCKRIIIPQHLLTPLNLSDLPAGTKLNLPIVSLQNAPSGSASGRSPVRPPTKPQTALSSKTTMASTTPVSDPVIKKNGQFIIPERPAPTLVLLRKADLKRIKTKSQSRDSKIADHLKNLNFLATRVMSSSQVKHTLPNGLGLEDKYSEQSNTELVDLLNLPAPQIKTTAGLKSIIDAPKVGHLRYTNMVMKMDEAGKVITHCFYDDMTVAPFVLRDHTQLNTSVSKMWHCGHCDVKLKYRGKLDRHLISHMQKAQYPHECRTCGKKFARDYLLSSHMKLHASSDSFKCKYDNCDYITLHSQNMRRHIRRMHTFEKPFSCDACGKCFVTKEEVKEHARVYHNPNPLSKLRKGRTRMVVELPENPYHCGKCDFAAQTVNELTTHVTKIHRL